MRASRIVAACLAAIVVIVGWPPMLRAQSDSGEILIAVTDALTKAPIGMARVLLDGPVIASELTGQNGKVEFTDVPDGIYRARVLARGYGSITSASFEVLDGRRVTVSVALVSPTGGLKVIGSVSVKASATISTTSIDANSAQRRLSDDLAGALNKLSGVSVSTNGDDSDATQTISLEGHDASQTQLTLDGIPLNAPGSAGDLRGFATDLFQGASVHMGPSAGALGGSVNFSTLQPTLSWLSQGSLSMGSYGRYNGSFAESGSLGKLGIAAEGVYRALTSPVDGDRFLDASGLDYVHDGDGTIAGSLFKLRYQFGDTQTITGTFLGSTREQNIVCLRQSGFDSAPCGYGPGNTLNGNLQLFSLTDNALLGATEVRASVFSMASDGVTDELSRFINVGTLADPLPSPDPNGFISNSRSKGVSINATLPAKQHHTISIQAYAVGSQSATSPLVPQAAPYYTGSFATNYAALTASDAIQSNAKLTLNDSIGLSGATGSGASVLGSVGATYRPGSFDTLAASYAVGGAAATAGRSTVLTDPGSLRFTCDGAGASFAYGNAPGAQPGPSSSISYRVGYTRALHGGNLSLQLYKQIQAGVLLPVQVNGTTLLAQGVLSPGYLALVQGLYDSAAGCNAAPGTPFGAQQLYLSSAVGGVRRVYEGGEFSGFVTLGDLVVQPYYNVTVSQAISNSPYFTDPYAITLSGVQLPNVPLQKAGIVLDYKAPHSALEWLADAQYTASNNPNDLPAYVTVDAGATAQLDRGTLTLAASNITNAYAGVFASPLNAIAYRTLGGLTVPTIARPLTPRTYSVTYGIRFGAGALTSQTGTAFHVRGERGAPGAPGSPNDQRRRGGFRRFFSPLPDTPPSDPLAVNGDATRCSRTGSDAATHLAGEVQAFVVQIEAAKRGGVYPATVAAPVLSDAVLTYHGLGTTYAITIEPKAGMTFRTVIGCFTMHLARADDVSQRKLYAPTSTLFFVPQVTFMPAVGLYIVARTPTPGREQFRVYALPTSPPSDPFEVRIAPECTGDAKNLATQFLGELREHFAKGRVAPSWTITPHAAKSGTWYELAASDPSAIGALLQCGRVAAASDAQLTQRGYAGKPVPEVNYTPALGLYFVRPPRPPRPSPAP